jgi:hypothetical protein
MEGEDRGKQGEGAVALRQGKQWQSEGKDGSDMRGSFHVLALCIGYVALSRVGKAAEI